MVDIEGEPKFEKEFLKRPPDVGLAVAEGRLKRRLSKIPSLRVLSRWPSDGDQVLMTPSPRMIRWAMSLSGSQLREAADFNLDFETLTHEQQAHFLRDMPIGGLMAGLVGGGSKSNWVGIAYTSMFTFKDPKTGDQVSTYITPKITTKRPVRRPSQAAINTEITEKIEESGQFVGPILQFECSIEPLASIVQKAESQFKVRYMYDLRLSNAKVLIAGRFDQNLFERAFEIIATTSKPAYSHSRNDFVNSELSAALNGTMGILGELQKSEFSIKEVLSGDLLTVAAISERSPAMEATFEKRGLSYDARAKIEPALIIYFESADQRVAYLIRRRP